MTSYIFSQLTEETLKTLVRLNEKYTAPEEWEKMQVALTAEESRRLEDIKSTLYRRHLVVMNEATLWARDLSDVGTCRTGTYSSVEWRATESFISNV